VVLEVSTPIQAQNSLENIHENSSEISVFGSNSRKKDKTGIFAKLLEGLTGKSRGKINGSGSIGAGPKGSEISLDNEQTSIEEGISGVKTGKKPSKSGKTPFLSAENGEQGSVFPLFLDFQGQSPQLKMDFNVSEEGEALDLLAGSLRRGGSGRNQVLSDGQFVQFNIENLENQPQTALNALKAGEGEAQSSLLANGANGKGKTARGAVDLLSTSARNIETPLHQFSGEKRPGLIDAHSSQYANAGEGAKNQEQRGRKKTNLEIRDLRNHEGPNAAENLKSPVNPVFLSERIDAELKVELRSEFHTDSRINGQPQGRGGDSQGISRGFEETLSRELGEHLSNDIVRQASIILRNQGEGIIRLSLKPETLGNVKIRVEMTENKITGHIVVESSEAFKAFERELPVLEKQFQDSGFSEARLDMSFAGEGGNYGAGPREDSGEALRFSQVLAASLYDAETEKSEAVMSGVSEISGGIRSGRSTVNILV
jgi:hypothetical protein